MSDLRDNLISGGDSGSDLGVALARLNKALESLDNAVDSALGSQTKNSNPDEEFQRMAEDRAKLAQELDSSQERANRLAETNREVSRRLVNAMETVRNVMDGP